MQAAEKVLRHAGVTEFEPVTPAHMNLTEGTFSFDKHPEPDVKHLVAKLRKAFEKPMAELKQLINTHWPELDFQGLADEV